MRMFKLKSLIKATKIRVKVIHSVVMYRSEM